MNENVIYTVITGNADKLRNPSVLSIGWDHICFTDNPHLKSDVWKIVLIKDKIEPRKLSRKVKLLPHLYLEDYKISLYIDSYILINRDINEFVEQQLVKGDVVVKTHPRRNNISDELKQIIVLGKDDPEIVTEQVLNYKAEGFNKDLLFENGIMIRRHNTNGCMNIMNAWWNQIQRYSYRDQLSLPYVLWKLNYQVGSFTQGKAERYFSILSKFTSKKKDAVIFEGTPYGPNLQYGRAINEFCEQAPKDSWIIIRDRDTMYLEDNGQQIIDIANRYPDTGVFGCMTNRLGLNWQLPDGKISDDPNIINHKLIATHLKAKHNTECATLGTCVAGLFLMFKKSTWERVKFREGNIIQNDIYFDWDFVSRILTLGMPIRLMLGVYLFHYYRLDKDIRDVTHLI